MALDFNFFGFCKNLSVFRLPTLIEHVLVQGKEGLHRREKPSLGFWGKPALVEK